VYRAGDQQLHCPCHEGRFAVETGQALSGPPRRSLPRIVLAFRGGEIWATEVEV
jgi:Rieske Fe-S protein